MIQQTSLQAYVSVVGGLSRRQDVVYQLFLRYKCPFSNREISKHLGWPINCVTPRVLELRKLGLLKCVGYQVNPQGRSEIVWGVV